MQKVQDIMLAEVQGRCREVQGGAGAVHSDSQVHRPRVIVNFQLSQLISKLTDRILMPLAEVIDLIELT